MYTVTESTPAGMVYGFSVLLAVGTGLTYQNGYALASIILTRKRLPPNEIQSSVSLINIAQIATITVTLLVCGQIFQGVAFKSLSKVLEGLGYGHDDIESLIAGTQSTVFRQLSPELRAQCIHALMGAIRYTYAVSICGGGIVLLVALLMDKKRLFGIEAAAGGG